jgi:hypothetical protein
MSETPVRADDPAPEPPASTGAGTERYKARGVWIRAAFYIAGTHVFGAFVWLLFKVGGE